MFYFYELSKKDEALQKCNSLITQTLPRASQPTVGGEEKTRRCEGGCHVIGNICSGITCIHNVNRSQIRVKIFWRSPTFFRDCKVADLQNWISFTKALFDPIRRVILALIIVPVDNIAPSEKMSQRSRAVGNNVSGLTGPRFEPQTLPRFSDERVTARPTCRFKFGKDLKSIENSQC